METTSFNPDRLTYPGSYVPFPSGSEWLIGLFETKTATEAGIKNCDGSPAPTQYSWEQFCFEPSSGRLKRHRIVKNPAQLMTLGGEDILREYEDRPPLEGNVDYESWYGGDLDLGGHLKTGHLSAGQNRPFLAADRDR